MSHARNVAIVIASVALTACIQPPDVDRSPQDEPESTSDSLGTQPGPSGKADSSGAAASGEVVWEADPTPTGSGAPALGCVDDRDCPDPLFCGARDLCVMCERDRDCDDEVCSPDGLCVACATNDDCTDDELCRADSVCVECLNDGDCNSDEFCDDGSCADR